MTQKNHREKILQISLNLFCRIGSVATTTNHIAKTLGISPGNLYFHFSDREAIARELFGKMSEETYLLWGSINPLLSPTEFVKQSFEIFWKYRFFHREMYHLRRRDRLLSELWKAHIHKCSRLLRRYYKHWFLKGYMKPILDPKEMQMIITLVLASSSHFLQFYESSEKPLERKSIKPGVQHILRLLLPYLKSPAKKEALDYLAQN